MIAVSTVYTASAVRRTTDRGRGERRSRLLINDCMAWNRPLPARVHTSLYTLCWHSAISWMDSQIHDPPPPANTFLHNVDESCSRYSGGSEEAAGSFHHQLLAISSASHTTDTSLCDPCRRFHTQPTASSRFTSHLTAHAATPQSDRIIKPRSWKARRFSSTCAPPSVRRQMSSPSLTRKRQPSRAEPSRTKVHYRVRGRIVHWLEIHGVSRCKEIPPCFTWWRCTARDQSSN